MSRISRGGVFKALDYRDGAVFATSQEAVALVADQTAEATRIHPAAPVSFSRAKTTQSEGKGGEEPTQHDARAAQVRAALDGVKLEGIESRYGYRFAKRAFDILFSALVLVCFSWLFVIIAILIKIDDPKGPVFFKQKRVGELDAKGNPRYFTMYKFRSMCVDAESRLADLRELNEKTGPVFKIADDPRVTRVGKRLRKLSLASVIIGTPGDGESTKSLSRSANSSLDLQLCERRPGLCSTCNSHYKPFEFLSLGIFGGVPSLSRNLVGCNGFNPSEESAIRVSFLGFGKDGACAAW